MAVFQIDKDLIVLNPEAIKLVPELKSLNQQELKYVILVVDYVDSPYRKKPFEERQLMARKTVYGDMKNNPETEKIRLAMVGYKSLVFDIRRETIDVYKKKVLILHKETLNETLSDSRVREIDKSITFYQDRISSMERDLDIEETDKVEIKGGKKLSYLEMWQRNQKNFIEYQKS